MDVFTKEKRSEVMSKIRSSGTWPEREAARLMRGGGIRYRSHPRLHGSPDFIVEGRLVLFCDGSFWHGRDWPGLGAARDRGRARREGPGGRGRVRARGAAARPGDPAVRGTGGPRGRRPRPGGAVPAHPGTRGGPRGARSVRRGPDRDRRGPGVRPAGPPGDAARAARVPGRSAAVLDVHFPGLKDEPAATGRCSGHGGIKGMRACLVRTPRHSEGGAVRSGDGDGKPHDRPRGTRGTVGHADTAGEAAIGEPEGVVPGMAAECGEGHEMRAALPGARPHALASPGHPGIPPERQGGAGDARGAGQGRGLAAGRGARPACAASP